MARSSSPNRFFELLRVLVQHEVEFVLIGGFALAFHGVPRATKDIDIVPGPNRENLGRLWQALAVVNARPGELADFRADEIPVPWTLDGLVDGAGNWILDTDLGRIDVMQWVSGVESYEQLHGRAERLDVPEVGGVVAVAGLRDLLAMKEAAGRDQDLIDIAALRMANGLEE